MAEPSRYGYEVKDVDIKAVFKFGVILIAFTVIIHLLVLGIYLAFTGRILDSQTPSSPLVKNQPSKIPQDLDKTFPQPRLQERDDVDMAELKTQQQAKLNSCGWVDRKNRIVHIPISQAMELLIERKKKGSD